MLDNRVKPAVQEMHPNQWTCFRCHIPVNYPRAHRMYIACYWWMLKMRWMRMWYRRTSK
jgi:hypothetical protein